MLFFQGKSIKPFSRKPKLTKKGRFSKFKKCYDSSSLVVCWWHQLWLMSIDQLIPSTPLMQASMQPPGKFSGNYIKLSSDIDSMPFFCNRDFDSYQAPQAAPLGGEASWSTAGVSDSTYTTTYTGGTFKIKIFPH